MMREHPEAYSPQRRRAAERHAAARSDRGAGADDSARAARRRRGRVRHRLLERRQPDPGALGAPRRRAGGARRARREPRRAAADAAGREPGALRRRRGARRAAGAAVRRRRRTLRRALLGARARRDRRRQPARGSAPAWRWPRPCCSPTSRGCRRRMRPAGLGLASGSVRITPGTNRRLRVFATTQIAFSFVLLAGAGDAARRARVACRRRTPATTCGRCWRSTCRRRRRASAARRCSTSIRKRRGASASCPASRASRSAASCRGATPAACGPAFQFAVEGYTPATAKRIRTPGCASSRPASSPCSACRCVAGRDFTDDDRARQRAGRDRQPERRAAAVPERRRGEPAACGGPIRSSAAPAPRRIVGVVADVDDENVVPGPALTIYHPVQQLRRRRPPVRARGGRSVRARAGGDAHHSRDVGRTSRSSAPRRSRTCARRCWRPNG